MARRGYTRYDWTTLDPLIEADLAQEPPLTLDQIAEKYPAIGEKGRSALGMPVLKLKRQRQGSTPAEASASPAQETPMPIQFDPLPTDEVTVLPGQLSIDGAETAHTPDAVSVSASADIVPVSEISEPLSPTEVQTLAHYEEIIAQGIQTFVQVGQALLTIRDHRLYRDTYATFEGYCRQRWDLSRPRAYQLMEAAEVTERLSTIVDIIPANEAQARPLTILPPEQQQEAWKEAIETAPPSGVTAKHVQKAVKRVKERTTTPKAPVPAPQPKRQPRMEVQDGLVDLLKAIPDREAWPILGELALLLGKFVEPRAETPLGQDMGKQLAALWEIIQQHELG